MRWWAKAALGAAVFGGVTLALLGVPSDEFAFTGSGGGGASMGHGKPQDGILDPGDLGTYQRKPDAGSITPLLAARAAGLRMLAGDHGDVVVFRPNGAAPVDGKQTLVEHRALAWVDFNAASGLFHVPELGLRDVAEVTLPQVGYWDEASGAYARRDVHLRLVGEGPEGRTYPAGKHSGWVTKGDRNAYLDQDPGDAGPRVSGLVSPEWVEARLVRVVDSEKLMRELLVGLAGSVLAGFAGTKVRDMLRMRKNDDAGTTTTKGGLWNRMRRPNCECGSPWGDLSFCARCGAERAPRHRYSTLEELQRAKAAKAARRR